MAAAGGPMTTIVPFADRSKLPACAAACGPLYDANGACVPPAIPQNQPAAYTSCFCLDPRVAKFSSTTAGVCDSACTADPNGLKSITAWFHNVCNVQANAGSPTTSTSATGSSTSIPAPQQSQQSGDWISNHYQWVIMLVVLVVGIAGIWVGACIWRRRYLRRRDLQKQTAGNTDSWGPALGSDSASGIPMNYTAKGGDGPDLPTFTSAAEKRNTTSSSFFSRS